jgi:hypothetical protein
MNNEFHYNYKLNKEYITLYVNRQLSRKYVSRGKTWHDVVTGPEMKIMTKIATTEGVIDSNLNGDSELVAIDGNRAVIKTHLLCHKAQRRVVRMVVRRLQRLLAPNSSMRKVDWQVEVEKPKVAPALSAAQLSSVQLFKEASKLFPNQDPIRLAAGLKDFNMPPENVLEVLRHLKEHFQGEQADMIRLASGYNGILRQYKNDWKVPFHKKDGEK